MPHEPDGEGPVTQDEAKVRAMDVLGKPEHQKPKGSMEDQSTQDDSLEDPAKTEETE